MEYYYYFLFRLYWSFRNLSKDNHKEAKSKTSGMSCIFLCFTLFSLIGLVNYFNINPIPSLKSKYLLLPFIVIIYIINYFFFIKKEKFLNQNFTKDKKGGFLIVLYIILLVITFIIGANKNHEKISRERDKQRIETNQ
jgi:UDP-N-acetylmuramyl pentapeptide phosphotransferase/UDP-N-acetylglucosamine-1-phosphate transferase